MLCKSGKHEWLSPQDAEKCCNGYRRELEIKTIETPNGLAMLLSRQWVKIVARDD